LHVRDNVSHLIQPKSKLGLSIMPILSTCHRTSKTATLIYVSFTITSIIITVITEKNTITHLTT